MTNLRFNAAILYIRSNTALQEPTPTSHTQRNALLTIQPVFDVTLYYNEASLALWNICRDVCSNILDFLDDFFVMSLQISLTESPSTNSPRCPNALILFRVVSNCADLPVAFCKNPINVWLGFHQIASQFSNFHNPQLNNKIFSKIFPITSFYH